ncbi:DUF1800 domain-containing protein [Massilia endophytica]|uniref:DUF1800 domain-containing protein n=1 Tax=Massilia endophytica TaxID=2899220 RepID=UPI001E3A1E82|nr:DUF1800 domain-containing protein [Massilia endophytica]UGQ47755.1 DUF1800 domain-containing protein [Massilia endophytica]
MKNQYHAFALALAVSFSSSAWAVTASVETTAKNGTVPLGKTVWLSGKVDGKGIYMDFSINGIAGGNATFGTVNSQNGEYRAPAVMPANPVITITGMTSKWASVSASASTTLTLVAGSTTPAPTPAPAPEPTPTPTPTPTPGPIGQQPAPDAQSIAAARFLQQATFGPTPADIAALRQMGQSAWLAQQFNAAPSPMPVTTDMNLLRSNWFKNMAAGQDQLRQRVIFALSQIFVVSADKNPYANEMQPWLATLQNHAFGNYYNLLREMSLNPSMGKYLDMGNSVIPAPNENYAREVMQLFTIGPVMLNQDGSVQLDRNGDPLASYNQQTIGETARALSGWTYAGSGAGINWENFTGPLQPRDAWHDKGSKTLLQGLVLPAGQSTQQDFDAVMQNLFQHPNLPPFVATRLIRALVTSNPSPAYIERVANVFANGPAGRGDMKATITAILTDAEARQDQPGDISGKLKDPILQTLALVRAMGGSVTNPNNLFWEYSLLGEKLLNAPSVFSFFSPLTPLPDNPGRFGPEFQLYAPALAVARANFIHRLLNGEFGGMIQLDITPYVNVAGDPTALLNLVDATLLQGRMSPTARQAIASSVSATSDKRQRAITALYLTAITADFTVQQ